MATAGSQRSWGLQGRRRKGRRHERERRVQMQTHFDAGAQNKRARAGELPQALRQCTVEREAAMQQAMLSNSWHDWASLFAAQDDQDELRERARARLQWASHTEAYSTAAVMRDALEHAALHDPAETLLLTLRSAVATDDFERASELRDSGLGLVGWYYGIPESDDGESACLMMVVPENGRLVGYAYSAYAVEELRQLALSETSSEMEPGLLDSAELGIGDVDDALYEDDDDNEHDETEQISVSFGTDTSYTFSHSGVHSAAGFVTSNNSVSTSANNADAAATQSIQPQLPEGNTRYTSRRHAAGQPLFELFIGHAAEQDMRTGEVRECIGLRPVAVRQKGKIMQQHIDQVNQVSPPLDFEDGPSSLLSSSENDVLVLGNTDNPPDDPDNGSSGEKLTIRGSQLPELDVSSDAHGALPVSPASQYESNNGERCLRSDEILEAMKSTETGNNTEEEASGETSVSESEAVASEATAAATDGGFVVRKREESHSDSNDNSSSANPGDAFSVLSNEADVHSESSGEEHAHEGFDGLIAIATNEYYATDVVRERLPAHMELVGAHEFRVQYDVESSDGIAINEPSGSSQMTATPLFDCFSRELSSTQSASGSDVLLHQQVTAADEETQEDSSDAARIVIQRSVQEADSATTAPAEGESQRVEEAVFHTVPPEMWVRQCLPSSVRFHRLDERRNEEPDPFQKIYTGMFGPHGMEVLQFERGWCGQLFSLCFTYGMTHQMIVQVVVHCVSGTLQVG